MNGRDTNRLSDFLFIPFAMTSHLHPCFREAGKQLLTKLSVCGLCSYERATPRRFFAPFHFITKSESVGGGGEVITPAAVMNRVDMS